MEEFSFGGSEVEEPVKIFFATVLSVDETSHTCDLRIGGPRGYSLSRIPYCTPSNSPNGSGIDFAPVTGSFCLVATELSNPKSPSDTIAYIIGFLPRLNRMGERYPSAEGDVVISSPEGNRLEVLSNGVNKLMAHEECSIELYPDSSKIETYCASKVIKTAGGYVEWLSSGDTEDAATSFKAVLKTEATRDINAGNLFLFEAADTGIPEVAVKILDPRDSEAPGRILWTGNADGDISIETEGSLASKYAGGVAVSSEISMQMKSPSIVLATPRAKVEINGGRVLIDADSVDIRSDRVHMQSKSTNQIFFTSGTEEIEDTLNKQLVTEDILGWLFNHVHVHAGMPPVGAPLVPNETLPVDEETTLAILLAKQAEAALFNLEEITILEGIETTIDTLSNNPTLLPLLEPISKILGILKLLAQTQRDGYLQAMTGSSTTGSGVLYSYGQVLTQDTKVR